MTQERICRGLHESALAGMYTVRLKGGDPFVFGRGGEEYRYLSERLVEVDIVPGITAAVAAAADAAVPLTERGHSSGVVLRTAHADPDGPETLTEVWYMGASRRRELSERLIGEGADPDAALLLVRNAGLADASVYPVTLGSLDEPDCPSPAVILSGPSASLYRSRDTWLCFGTSPPWSTGTIPGRIVSWPLISTEPLAGGLPGDLSSYRSVILTSPRAAEYFFRAARPAGLPLFSIGPSTSRAIRLAGYEPAFQSEVSDSEHLAVLVREKRLHPSLYPTSDRSDNALAEIPGVERRILYKTVFIRRDPLDWGLYRGAIFTSPSSVEAFMELESAIPARWMCWARGEMTARRLRERGCPEERMVIL